MAAAPRMPWPLRAPVRGAKAKRAERAPAPEASYTWKLSPQPQRPFSFGLVKVKPADMAFTS